MHVCICMSQNNNIEPFSNLSKTQRIIKREVLMIQSVPAAAKSWSTENQLLSFSIVSTNHRKEHLLNNAADNTVSNQHVKYPTEPINGAPLSSFLEEVLYKCSI